MQRLYGFDLGGSGFRFAPLNPETLELEGELTKRETSDFSSQQDLTAFLLGEIPKGSMVGIGAAGNLDPVGLTIAESPNSSLKGEITFPRDLRLAEREVTLTNDMPAGMMGTSVKLMGLKPFWFTNHGHGYNAGYCTEGIPFGSDPLRPNQRALFEIGHLTFQPKQLGDKYQDLTFLCPGSCNGVNHLEAITAGSSAAKLLKSTLGLLGPGDLIFEKARERLTKKGLIAADAKTDAAMVRTIYDNLHSLDVFDAYRQEPIGMQAVIYNLQREGVGLALATMASVFNVKPTPSHVVAIGSFALGERDLMNVAHAKFLSGAYDIGLPSMREELARAKPTLIYNDDPHAVLRGGAANLVASRSPEIYQQMLSKIG